HPRDDEVAVELFPKQPGDDGPDEAGDEGTRAKEHAIDGETAESEEPGDGGDGDDAGGGDRAETDRIEGAPEESLVDVPHEQVGRGGEQRVDRRGDRAEEDDEYDHGGEAAEAGHAEDVLGHLRADFRGVVDID